ncbi:MAG: ABC transporter ATP-binding protein [Planctomyces sp.]|nr:ABC transporter ATP-binding protein [Planctomyces sp.]
MASTSTKHDLEQGVWLFEQLLLERNIHDRKSPERVFFDVTTANSGPLPERWSRWFADAGHAFGLRGRMLDIRLSEIPAFPETGASIVLLVGEKVPQLVLIQPENRRTHIVSRYDSGPDQRHLDSNELSRLLQELAGPSATEKTKVPCLIFDPLPPVDISKSDHGETSPFLRLYRLLRPEWSDIWLVLVFSFVVGLLSLTTPIAVETLVNTVAFGRLLQPVVVLAIVLLIFLGLQGALRAVNTYVVEIIQRRLFVRVSADMADRLPRIRYVLTEHHSMRELVNRFFEVVTLQKITAQLLLDGIGLVLSTVIGMAVLAFYHPWLLGFDLFLLVSFAFIIFVLGYGAVDSAIKESKNKYYMAAWLEDIAAAPLAFRTHGGHDFALNEVDRLASNYLIARRSHFRILIRQIIFALGLQAIASTVLLGLGGWLVISGELTLGQLVAAELIVTVIVGAFAKLGKHLESFYDLLAAVDKLGIIFDLDLDRTDGIVALGTSGPVEVEFHQASYSRPGGITILKDSNLRLEPGTVACLWGGSGEGKSTILEIIAGFRPPTAGQVRLDGFLPQEIRPDMLQKRVALARPDEIFHGTIEDNIVLHRTDIIAADVHTLLKNIGLNEAILSREEGLRTVLKSDGAPLTENQSRLVSLARAMLSGPGLLLLDGLLDTLEEEDAAQVIKYLSKPEHGWTLVIATSQKHIAAQIPRVITVSELVGKSDPHPAED